MKRAGISAVRLNDSPGMRAAILILTEDEELDKIPKQLRQKLQGGPAEGTLTSV